MSAVQDRTCSGPGGGMEEQHTGCLQLSEGSAARRGMVVRGGLTRTLQKGLLEVDEGNLPSLMKGERLEGP